MNLTLVMTPTEFWIYQMSVDHVIGASAAVFGAGETDLLFLLLFGAFSFFLLDATGLSPARFNRASRSAMGVSSSSSALVMVISVGMQCCLMITCLL
jgi:hypothetical protein